MATLPLLATSSSLVFKVHRREPELITPAKPTPHELKHLSDIDDQEGLRFHIPLIHLYPNNNMSPSMQGKDPVKVIREALAKTLVFYYPFAGRLREGPNRKLMVECTGEGILFIEADADVTLEQFGDSLQPPFPCFEELLFDVPGSTGILNSPLLLIQVTRLKCGGFIFALRFNHTMSDGPGIAQFMSAVSEMAQGSQAPSVIPVWERHVLNACDPPQITHQHHEYEKPVSTTSTSNISISEEPLSLRSFFFGPEEVSTLRSLIPPNMQYTTLEIVIACLWKCRTIALQLDPTEEVRIMCNINARNKFNPPILPTGYYGNAFVFPAVVTSVSNLTQNPLEYALDLVQKTKAQFSKEYMRSVAALMVIRDRPVLNTQQSSFLVSDIRHAGFQDVDFGWGKPLYAGVAKSGAEDFLGASFFVKFNASQKNEKEGIVVPLYLPSLAMDRFVKELQIMFKKPTCEDIASKSSCL